ncbi:hypothetical protein MKW92_046633 [Papaver armeniacum]|nr:hypothetical protein MKW92_046633 [Papaver armeniacum]
MAEISIPGVYFHGKASVVIPAICRFKETRGSLVMYLMHLFGYLIWRLLTNLEYLLYVASIFTDSSTMTMSPVVYLKCFHKSFVGISSTCFSPTDGLGILIDLTDNQRWQPFALGPLISQTTRGGSRSPPGPLRLSVNA